jgi:ATP-dependent DNA ligase
MPRRLFEPCIPRGTKVPAGPDWIREIKHDGYRLIVQRDGKRVRLFTRNGHDWTDRYPLDPDRTIDFCFNRIKKTALGHACMNDVSVGWDQLCSNYQT